MIEKNFSDKIMSEIEKKKLKPKPRWEFVFKNYFLWIIGFFSLIFGALSFSLIIYLFNSGGEVFFDNFGASFWEVFLTVIPIFWLVFLALFVSLFYLNLKKTKKAYKYSPFLIIAIGLIASLALGSSFYMLGFSKKLDNLLGKNINPFVYGHLMNPQLEFWSNPENGRLAGIISEIGDGQKLFLIDKDSKEWLVYYDQAEIKPAVNLEKGYPVKFFGEILEDNQFGAIRVMPMHSANDFFERPGIRRHLEDSLFRPRMESRGRVLEKCALHKDCLFE
jgi:hypothetical protein